ncbi:MAG: hypothetical protein NT069_19880 [Planctomycetota bacterium]|nr:hypothetical protein [Planctomycetota bacterium]
MTEDELSRTWKQEGLRHANVVNDYVRRGLTEGWESVADVPRETLEDNRGPLAQAVMQIVREANRRGETDGLRERFPPAQEPLLAMLDEQGQSLPLALLLDDGRVVLQVGSPTESPRFHLIEGTTVTELPGLKAIGRSPDRRFFALATEAGVNVHDGWQGPVISRLSWPTGLEGIPKELNVPAPKSPPPVTRLVPFADGRRALFVSETGVFVLQSDGAVRLLPTTAEFVDAFALFRDDESSGPGTYRLYMEHGAVSPDGKWIAAGHQGSQHLVFDAETLAVAGEIGPQCEYPHFAAFNADSSLILFNSCHFYLGITIGVPPCELPGLHTKPFEQAPPLIALDDGMRVYAAVSRGDEFIVSDAYGYLRAFDFAGKYRWQHFIGSTIEAIDISLDGKKLIVTSCAGFLCLLDLDTGERDPQTISTATHRETRRWIFWKNEPAPLIW